MRISYFSSLIKLRKFVMFQAKLEHQLIILLMQKQKFLLQPDQLQKSIFSTYAVRLGVSTVLNINFLPDLLQYVKKQLLSEELLLLEDYYLQNYLMQLSMGYKGKSELHELVSTIVSHIRSNNHFWYRHNNKQIIREEQEMKSHAISTYQKDIARLQKTFKKQDKMEEFVPTYPKKTSTHYCYRLLHINQPYSTTKHSLNHLPYIPQFFSQILKKLNNRTQPLQNQESDPNSSQFQKKEKQIIQLMRQCILFIIKNKSTKVVIKQRLASDHFSEEEEEEVEEEEVQEDQKEVEEDDAQGLQIEQEEESQVLQEVIYPLKNQKQVEQQKTITGDFLRFLEPFPNIPKFQSSHHMYNITNNLLLICQSLTLNYEKYSTILSQKVEKPKFKRHQLQDYKDIIQISESCKEGLSNLSQRELSQAESEGILKCFLQLWSSKLKHLQQEIQSKLEFSQRGWLCTPEELQAVKQSYEEMLSKPEFVQLNRFKAMGVGVPWSQQDYRNFLKGLAEFINIPTNNKKIATLMGENIEPNHVKHVKGVYLNTMKERIERGECGGGRRGKSLSKSDFIEKDIEFFSMRWFEKGKKLKKRLKKMQRNSEEQQEEEQVDSQY